MAGINHYDENEYLPRLKFKDRPKLHESILHVSADETSNETIEMLNTMVERVNQKEPFNYLRTFQKVYNFFQLHPSISLSEFSREIGKNRNYMANLFKSNVITEKQFKKLLPYLQKYGYTKDVL